MKEKRLGLLLLLLITIFLVADQAALVPNYILVEKDFGITHSQIGMVSFIFVIVGGVATLLWGYWVDKYSRKKMLVIGVLSGEIPCFLTAFAQSYPQLLVIRSLTGLGMGVVLAAGSSLLGDYFPSQKRGKGFGWFLFAMGLGYLVGAGIAGTMGPLFNWRYPFVICAGFNFILVPLYYYLAKEPKRGEVEPELKKLISVGATYIYKVKLADFKKVVTIPTNLFLNLQSIAGCIPWGVLIFWVITFCVEEKNLTIPVATIIALIFGLGKLSGNLYGGYLGDYFHQKGIKWRTLLCIISILGAAPFLVWGISYSIPLDAGFFHLLGFAFLGFAGISIASIASPNLRAIFLDVNLPENRGSMLSVANLTDVIGAMSIGPLIGGILAENYGLTFTFYFSFLFWIPCVLLWLPLFKTVPKDMENLRKTMSSRAKQN